MVDGIAMVVAFARVAERRGPSSTKCGEVEQWGEPDHVNWLTIKAVTDQTC